MAVTADEAFWIAVASVGLATGLILLGYGFVALIDALYRRQGFP